MKKITKIIIIVLSILLISALIIFIINKNSNSESIEKFVTDEITVGDYSYTLDLPTGMYKIYDSEGELILTLYNEDELNYYLENPEEMNLKVNNNEEIISNSLGDIENLDEE